MTTNSLTKEQIKEFLKLYDYKVPNFPHSNYYLDIQSKYIESFNKDIQDFLTSWNYFVASGKTSYKAYKLDLIDKVIKHLQEDLKRLNQAPMIEHGLSTKDGELKPGIYVSVDLVEANHYSFWDLAGTKMTVGFSDTPMFKQLFNNDPALLNSKSVRQYIYGNLNPKRQIQHQKRTIKNIIDALDLDESQIIKINSDEVVFKLMSTDFDVQATKNLLTSVIEKFRDNTLNHIPYRVNVFEITEDILHNDKVKIKTNLITGKKKFHGILGNRYFLYLPLIYPEHIPCERDYYFTLEGKLVKWLE